MSSDIDRFVRDVGDAPTVVYLDGFIAGMTTLRHHVVMVISMTDTERGVEVARDVAEEFAGAKFWLERG